MSELQETYTIKFVQLHELTLNSFQTLPQPLKKSPFGPQKIKKTQKLSQNQISEFTETFKMKIVQVHE